MLVAICSFEGAFKECQTEFAVSDQTLPMSGRKSAGPAKPVKIRSNTGRCWGEIQKFAHLFPNAAQNTRNSAQTCSSRIKHRHLLGEPADFRFDTLVCRTATPKKRQTARK